ncbi:ArsR/SmtB family transcription factor [Parenemella sanctibonifatiensis]|uniref:ArsR family transcriptional regulator n=1 Tax=Parenemella sanctibonifatiensis TaxID=2016505 RepID=A0A255ELQ7_9ACTN|nr:winged helix-turn-helix domain-containing protein [Parenemella sanctibonifatiensis]OYN92467.1 ArsR family transcriptional regulator [Parenemella sanctibonifatiensis]
MSVKTLDYDLPDRLALTQPEQVRALGNPLRTTILGLLHERAASVTELSTAVARPKSTVAHHVKVLAEAGLVHVVRTRRVRAVEESFYGRTARLFYVQLEDGGEDHPQDFNDFEVAARESAPAYAEGQLWGFVRRARISAAQRREFWQKMTALVDEFDSIEREGDVVHGFALGIYPIPDYPQLPEPTD